MTRRLAVTIALAALAVLAGCGIPVSASPHLLSKSVVPEALLQSPSPPPVSDHTEKSTELPIDIYLVQASSGDLVAVPRFIAKPATAQEVLDQLEGGPLSTEYHAGDESAISTYSHLLVVGRTVHHVVTVELDQSFSQLRGDAPIDELGQIVWSLTGAPLDPRVHAVRFVGTDGQPVAVETDKGGFQSGPIDRGYYRCLTAGAAC